MCINCMRFFQLTLNHFIRAVLSKFTIFIECVDIDFIFEPNKTYVLIFILREQFSDVRYYFHIVKFILFIRIIRQEHVSSTDINFAQHLINSFIVFSSWKSRKSRSDLLYLSTIVEFI